MGQLQKDAGFAVDDTAHPATRAYELWPIGSERSALK
jgi:hypothetical protein